MAMTEEERGNFMKELDRLSDGAVRLIRNSPKLYTPEKRVLADDCLAQREKKERDGRLEIDRGLMNAAERSAAADEQSVSIAQKSLTLSKRALGISIVAALAAIVAAYAALHAK